MDQVVAEADIAKLTFTPALNANGLGYASFTFKVSDDTDESASDYTMRIDVTAVNDAATGAPEITGTPQVGEMLTATIGTIADADGLPTGTFPASYTFEWVRVDGSNTETQVGTDSSTYTPEAADVGSTIRVEVSFTDNAGNAEDPLASDVTAPVAPVPVTIKANYARIGAGIDDLVFTLTREGSTTNALKATVTIGQEQTWLGAPDLSHTVTFEAGADEATRTITSSEVSLSPETSGNLTATVSGDAVVDGEEVVVEMISIAHPPITIAFDQEAYTFAEGAPAADVNIYVVATLDDTLSPGHADGQHLGHS